MSGLSCRGPDQMYCMSWEHVRNPFTIFSNCSSWLKPGRRIFISVPPILARSRLGFRLFPVYSQWNQGISTDCRLDCQRHMADGRTLCTDCIGNRVKFSVLKIPHHERTRLLSAPHCCEAWRQNLLSEQYAQKTSGFSGLGSRSNEAGQLRCSN
jgi:hypothetical protein